MKKKYNALTEHYLVPLILFLLNICLAHVIYAFTASSSYTAADKTALTLAFTLFIISLSLKKQALLGASIVFYAAVIICT
jgi:hypothetical protein